MTLTTRDLALLRRPIAPEVAALRAWRRAHRLTVDELAAVLGVHASSLRLVEVGMRAMPRAWRVKISALYARWDERLRPARPPERRGRYDRKTVRR